MPMISTTLRVCCLITMQLSVLRAQTTWFQDDFSRKDFGTSWRPATGLWSIEQGAASIRTKEYDQLLSSSYYVFGLQPFSVEVTLRGIRAGIYFNLDDTTSKNLSQMVRFDENSILTGYFNGNGEFTATNTFAVAKSPTDWTELRVDVNPGRKRCEVFVNGVSVGIDENIAYTSGYVGLEASDGLCQFKSFKVSGAIRARIPSKPRNGTKIRFQHVSVVQVEGKNVVIFNPELRLWQTLNPDGKVIRQEARKLKPTLTRRVTFANRTYSIRNNKIYVSNEAGATVDSISERLIAPYALLLDSRAKTVMIDVADVGANAVFQFDVTGRLCNAIAGETIGGFKAPRGIALYGEDRLVIADYDKIVFFDPRVDTNAVFVAPLSPHEAEITWYSLTRAHTFVQYAPDGGPTKTLIQVSVHSNGKRTAKLEHLRPLTRYSFRLSPTLNTIPEDCSISKTYRFATPPTDTSQMAFTRLPVMCMVYRTISYRDKYPKKEFPQIPDGRTISNEELDYLRRATTFNREFYFRNSSCKLVLDFDFYVVEDTLWLHEVGDSDPYWLSSNDRVTKDYETAARHFGRIPQYYAGLICPYAWQNYPPRRTSALRDPSIKDSINIRQAVGGGTNGVPAPWKYGSTTGFTSNPFQDEFSRQDWLITHEFHHQIDALQAASGYPEYYHADMPWLMPGRFGEDFDFNAHIIRNAPVSTWLTLKFGTLTQTPDADHDGVPDDDLSLPFDEKRIGGNPNSKDTDGDGLDDLQEVMAGNSRGTAVNNKDTDGDGLTDNIDPEPLYATDPVIEKLDSSGGLRSKVFAALNFEDLRASTYLRWDDHFLYVNATTDKPANLLIQIDADNDGWFHGFDNFQARIMNNGDSVWVADYYLRDCSSWTESPRDRRDILRRSDLQILCSVNPAPHQSRDSVYSLTVKIPRNDAYGLSLRPGKRMSVRLGLQTKPDLWVWDELFERNYTMQITLR
ncbi:MAG TPA: hypothetical protein VI758_05480 [Bacteroidota bacterium]